MDTPIWMQPAVDRLADSPLDVQSRGRDLSAAETHFADTLETLFAEGCHDFGQLATRLNELGVEAPVSGSVNWTIETLGDELRAINAQLDAAFEENGYGA